MKTIKLLSILILSSFAFSSLSAQVNVQFDHYIYSDSCDSQEIQFTDSSTNVPQGATYLWDFGDGTSSTMQTPTHWFFPTSPPQTFIVTLSILMNGNVIGSSTNQIIIGYPQNDVSFVYNGASGCSFPQTYTFSGFETTPNAPNYIANWDWYVNNQYAGSNQTLSYVFPAAGTYTVQLYGSTINGCFTEYLETLTVGSSNLSGIASHQVISSDCQGAFVDLYSTITGGNAPFTFSWSHNNTVFSTSANPQQEYILTSVDPNVFLEVTDANGCSVSTSVFIPNTLNNLSVQTSSAPASACAQNCDGELFVSATGGSGPYVFILTPGNITQTGTSQVSFSGLCAGLYDVTISDANNCSTIVTDSVYQNNNPITAFTSSSPTSSCSQSCDGSIDVSATGQNGPYVFVLLPGNQTQTGFQASYPNLCLGSYTIEITDNNGCSTVLSETVFPDSLSSIILDAIVTNGNACDSLNSCNASIEVIASNGVAPYQYSLDFGSTYQASNVFNGLCSGTYQVDVQDANGCTGSYFFIIQGSQPLGIQSSEYYEACDSSIGGNGSFIEVFAFGGSGQYTYLWSDGSTSSFLQNPSAGTYSVIVTDGNGCSISETFIVPSNQCYTISGNVYIDVNGNCVFDSTDYTVQSWVDLTATAGGPWLWIYDYTDANGAFEITAPAGTYFFDVNGYNVNNLTQTCPGLGYSVTLDANNPTAVVDFFLSPPAPVQDLSVATYPIYTPTPGFAYKTKVQYCNDGTIPMSGSVDVTYDANLIWILSGSATANGWPINTYPAPDNHDAVNRVLSFDFVSLNPGECRYLTITYETDPAAGLLPFDPIYMEAVVNPIPGDVTPTNNVAYYVDQVTSSWDPNDKAVYPVGDITVDDKDHSYHIRFQNEGNANATKVVVRDELDANLDLHSLRNVSASHDYIMTVENDNELVFTFNNIQLPPKDVDEEGSQGFVAFTLTQDGDLAVGTSIENTAAIYFDFNEAIITNTVVNTIVEKTVGISDLAILSALTISPNPSTGVFGLELGAGMEATSIRVFDVLGNAIMVMSNTKTNKMQINLQNSTSGIYFVEVITDNGTAVQKIVKK